MVVNSCTLLVQLLSGCYAVALVVGVVALWFSLAHRLSYGGSSGSGPAFLKSGFRTIFHAPRFVNRNSLCSYVSYNIQTEQAVLRGRPE